MRAYLKLFRVPNLLMVGLTMVLLRYSIVGPILSIYNIELRLPLFAFLSYVIATMLVAAAGYAINDYYDRDIDMVNRNPDDVIVGNQISSKLVIWLYRILNGISLLLAAYASYKNGVFALVILFAVMIGLFYFYSATYKNQLLIGNIIVALATAMVPVTVYLFEMPPVLNHYKYYIISGNINLSAVFGWILGFSTFAFLSGLAREIIKDMEDYEGDRFAGRNTIPLVWGMAWAKRISVALLMIIVAGIALTYYLYFISDNQPDFITLVYFSAFLAVPLVFNLYQLVKAKTLADYKFCGDLLKIIMLAGILYAPVVLYIIHKTF